MQLLSTSLDSTVSSQFLTRPLPFYLVLQKIQRNAEKEAEEGQRVAPSTAPRGGKEAVTPAKLTPQSDKHLAGERLTATKRRQLQQRDELQVGNPPP